MVNEPLTWFKILSVRKFQMNWKILLVIAGLSLSAGLTACNKEAATPDAPKTETGAPSATTETKPADGMKPGDSKTETKTETTKPGDSMKPGQTKTTETKTTKPDPTKKP
jgi:hypothetical protein